MDSSRTALMLLAIHTAVEPLATVPECPEARLLRQMAVDFEAAIRGWKPEVVDSDERELMMKRVLALNVAVAKHVRDARRSA
jgi:hypothetical protein